MSDDTDPDATGAAMFNATLAAVLNGAERDRLLRALDPLESERLAAKWGAHIEEKRGETAIEKARDAK